VEQPPPPDDQAPLASGDDLLPDGEVEDEEAAP
jgi:hypothetical protein